MRHECHLFAGLGGPFCAGGLKLIEKFIDKLDWSSELPKEADAHLHMHQEYMRVAREIVDRAQEDGKPDSIIIVGFSWGSLVALEVARYLQRFNLKVDYLAGIDPTAIFPWMKPMIIPENVKLCDEFWASSGPPARARKKHPGGKGGGMYLNPHSVPYNGPYKYQSGHIPLARNKDVRGRIVDQVKELVT